MPVTETAPIAGAGSARGPRAVAEAVAGALAGVPDPGHAVFFPSGFAPAEAAAQATEVAGAVPLTGMTSNGAIEPDGPIDEGCSAIAFGRDTMVAGHGLACHASRDPRAAARRAVASALAGADAALRHGVVLLLIDTRSGDQALAVTGAYEEAGPRCRLPAAPPAARSPLSSSRCRTEAARHSPTPWWRWRFASTRPIGRRHLARLPARRAVPAIVTRRRPERATSSTAGRPSTSTSRSSGFAGTGSTTSDFERARRAAPARPARAVAATCGCATCSARGSRAAWCAPPHPRQRRGRVRRADRTDAIVRSAWDAVERAVAALGDAPAARGAGVRLRGPQARARQLAAAGRRGAGVLGVLRRTAPPMAGIYTRGEVGRVRGAKGDRNHAVVVVAFA